MATAKRGSKPAQSKSAVRSVKQPTGLTAAEPASLVAMLPSRDVASLAGMTHLVVLEGVNDIVWPHTVLAGPDEEVRADDIIAGLRQVIARARIAGLKVAVGTVTPFEGTMSEVPNSGYYTAGKERTRQAVNKWIRSQDDDVHVLDFDAVLRDLAHPARLLPAFDSGDHIHPNDSGYRAMAEAVDLGWFN